MADKSTEAFISENGKSSYAVTISVSGHEIEGDEPVASGGKNLGPAPYDLLLSALGECTAMTIRWYALQKNWPVEKIEVKLSHRKVDGEGKSKRDVFEKEILLKAPSLDATQIAKLHEIAAKCPVQRTLEGTPLIRTV